MDPKPAAAAAAAKVSSPTRIPPPRGYALSGKIMLAAIVVLFSIVLLILFVHLYARFHLIRRRRRLQRRRLVFATGDGASASASPRGLDPAVLSSLAVEVFSPGDAGVAECAVCLSEFEEGEKVRVLPRCDHRFHIECIDMWFGSHNSCPLCRTPVEIEPPQGKAAETERQCADLEAGSSSDSSASIEISDGDERLRLGFGFRLGAILAAKRFWSRDREVDLERGTPQSTTPQGTPQSTTPQGTPQATTTPAVL